MIDLKSYLIDHNLKLDIDGVKPKFKCGICKDIICKPKTARCCCSFCETCITNFKNVNKNVQKCPSCSKDFDFGMDVSDDFNKEMKIGNLALKCPKLFCKEEVILHDMKGHLESCANEGVRCILGGLGCSGVTETNEDMDVHVNVNLTRHLSLIVERMNHDEDCRVQQNQVLQQKMEKIEKVLENMSKHLVDIKKEKSVQSQKQTETATKQVEMMKKQCELAQKQSELSRRQSATVYEQSEVCTRQNNVVICHIQKMRDIQQTLAKIDDTVSKDAPGSNKIPELMKRQTEVVQKQAEMLKKQGELAKKQNEMEQTQSKMVQNQEKLSQKQTDMSQSLSDTTKKLMQVDVKENTDDEEIQATKIVVQLSELLQKQSQLERSQSRMKEKLDEISVNQEQIVKLYNETMEIKSVPAELSVKQFKKNYKLNIDPVFEQGTGANLSMFAFVINAISEYNEHNYYFTDPFTLDGYHFKIRLSFEYDENFGNTLDFQVWLEASVTDDELEWPLMRPIQLEIHKTNKVHRMVHTFSYDTAPNKSKYLYNKPGSYSSTLKGSQFCNSSNGFLKTYKVSRYDVVNSDGAVRVALKLLE